MYQNFRYVINADILSSIFRRHYLWTTYFSHGQILSPHQIRTSFSSFYL